jgi:hypothetical protein
LPLVDASANRIGDTGVSFLHGVLLSRHSPLCDRVVE